MTVQIVNMIDFVILDFLADYTYNAILYFIVFIEDGEHCGVLAENCEPGQILPKPAGQRI